MSQRADKSRAVYPADTKGPRRMRRPASIAARRRVQQNKNMIAALNSRAEQRAASWFQYPHEATHRDDGADVLR